MVCIYQISNYSFQQEKERKQQEKLKKEQEKEKKKAVTSSISSILKAKERSTKKQPVVKTDSDEDDEMEVSTKGKRTSIIESAQDFLIKLDMKLCMHLKVS